MSTRPPGTWPYDALVTYHGWFEPNDDSRGIVAVEISEFGPTERRDTITLYHLSNQFGFNWGYSGGGPSRVTAAILSDALGRESWGDMHGAFLDDVVSQFAAEWRMRRSAILRWARGWVADQPAEQQLDVLPRALVDIPPADPLAYQHRP